MKPERPIPGKRMMKEWRKEASVKESERARQRLLLLRARSMPERVVAVRPWVE